MIKKLTKLTVLTLAIAASIALPVSAQSTNSVVPQTVWDVLTTGSNYFVVPFMTKAQGDNTFGGGLAIGYKATEALALVGRFDEFAGKTYLGNLSLQLSVPRSLMGKVPVVPFVVAGAGVPFSTATLDNNVTVSAGQPVGIIGAGAYVPLDFLGSSSFFQKTFLVADYEHWTGAGLPAKQQNQFRFGLGVKF